MPRNYPRNDLRSTARIGRHPIHAMLVPIPIACFVGALITDIVYWRTAEIMWSNFSSWLITVGVIFAFLAAIAGLIDFLSNRAVRRLPPAWPHLIGNLAVLVLASINMLVHTHDGWTSVVPWGLRLSAATVFILLFTGWFGWSMVYRRGAGVAEVS